jgi:two-component system OmpR family response regulator
MRIALVEDNDRPAQGIENALRDLGHAMDRQAGGTEWDGLLATKGAYLAIIAADLPRMDGFEVLRALRRRGDDMPVVMLTARRHRRLGRGAGRGRRRRHDQALRHGRASRAHLRPVAPPPRHGAAPTWRRPDMAPRRERIGALTYDCEARALTGPDGALELPRRELALFECLVDRCGQIVSKDRIAEALYGVGGAPEPNTVKLLISRLRRKFAGAGA